MRRGGVVLEDAPLRPLGIAQVVKVYAEKTGPYAPADCSGHSLRSGFLTSAAASGASVFELIERHKSVDSLTADGRIALVATGLQEALGAAKQPLRHLTAARRVILVVDQRMRGMIGSIHSISSPRLCRAVMRASPFACLAGPRASA